MTDPNDHSNTPAPELHPDFSSPGAQPTSWAQVVDVLDRAGIFWISTLRPDNRPHVAPLPAMWLRDTLHFTTGLEEQKGRNLARNPQCVLTTGTNAYEQGLDVVVEGRAERVYDRATLESLARMWRIRLDWPYDVGDEGFRHRPDGQAPNVDTGSVPVFAVRPTKILAFARGNGFAQTRFRF